MTVGSESHTLNGRLIISISSYSPSGFCSAADFYSLTQIGIIAFACTRQTISEVLVFILSYPHSRSVAPALVDGIEIE